MIAVSISAKTLDQALQHISEVQVKTDLIELRLDLIKDFNPYLDAKRVLSAAVAASNVPIIFTFREQPNSSNSSKSCDFISELRNLISLRTLPLARDYFDFDCSHKCDVTFYLYKVYSELFGRSARVIASYHDFNGIPTNLDDLVIKLKSTSADVIKIAVTAGNFEDNVRILRILRDSSLPMISLAMGEFGKPSRLLALLGGSFLTFACTKPALETAAGQFTLEELCSVYRVKMINRETRFYCLLGYPVAHSASPYIHNAAFAAAGLNSVYLPIALSPSELASFVRNYVHPKTRQPEWHVLGASVTLPHKLAVRKYLDAMDQIAEQVGAVNTLVVSEGKLLGYNTDVMGAVAPLKKYKLKGLRVAILGSGGAARAVIVGLKREGARITIYARNFEQRRLLAAEFNVLHDDFANIKGGELLINATPIGMRGTSLEDALPLAEHLVTRFDVVYDLVYNPVMTKLLQVAQAAGKDIVTGLEMLVLQAGEQYRLWTSLEPPLDLMRLAAERWLER
ncbi:MAG: shikimate dehydrogenase [Acidobacteriota bacterium]|nr:shikimate dehydrogenase [Blastocatellia bacterium]MDW8412509.1 shikimate dehydrogenase [Acidobacteriota bacterium]